MLVEGTFDHMFNIWAEEFNLMRDGTGFYRVPLIQTITCILLSLYILHMSASRASYWQVILSISIGLATAGPSCFFKSQCSNRHVETNPLSIFSIFNSQLLFIFSFFCVGFYGDKPVGRRSGLCFQPFAQSF